MIWAKIVQVFARRLVPKIGRRVSSEAGVWRFDLVEIEANGTPGLAFRASP